VRNSFDCYFDFLAYKRTKLLFVLMMLDVELIPQVRLRILS